MQTSTQTANEKRYTVTLDLFVYALDDENVKKEVEELMRKIDNIGGKFNDNKASTLSIHETPFGSFDSREVA